MPRKCCIEGCANSEYVNNISLGSKISFHLFPKDDETKLNWKHYIRVCNNQEVSGKNSIICSDHFQPSDIIKKESKSILKPFAVPKIFPNSSPRHVPSLNEDGTPSDNVHYAHETIELPVFVSVDESSMESDEIPSTNQRADKMNIEPSENNIEIMNFVSVKEITNAPNQISTFPIKEEILQSVPSNDNTIASLSTSEEATTSTSVVYNEPSQITSEFVIKDEIDEDSSPAPSDSSGECEIVEPPNPSGNTFTKTPITTTVTISNLSMCPSLNPPMHPSLIRSMNNSNVVKGVPLSEYEMPQRKHVVRYAGDIDENGDITPEDAKKNLSFCKTKIKNQAKEIYRLKQTVKRQKEKIETMKNLLKKFKTSYGLSNRAIRSIDEVVMLED